MESHSIFAPHAHTHKSKHITILALAAIWIFISFPVFTRHLGWHDYAFHMQRISSLAQGLEYDFPVYLYPGISMDYGYPLGIFYGDTFLYPFAFLVKMQWLTLLQAMQMYVFCRNAALVVVSFYSFQHIFHSNRAALFGCALYSASVWPLTNLYIRCALGEYTAMIFLPLLAAGTYDIHKKENKKTGIILLSLAYTGLLRCHVITSILATAFLGLFILIEWRTFLQKKTAIALLCSAGLSLLLNISFIAPLLSYYASVPLNITKSEGGYLPIPAGSPGDKAGDGVSAALAQFYWISAHVRDFFIWRSPASGVISVGIALMATFSIGLTLLLRPLIRGKQHCTPRLLNIILALSTCSLWLSSIYFPWYIVAKHTPSLFNVFVAKVQFGMRYTTIALPLLTLLAMQVFVFLDSKSTTKPRRASIGFIAVVIFLLFAQSTTLLVSFNAKVDKNSPENRIGFLVYSADDWLYRLTGTEPPGEKEIDINHSPDILIENAARAGFIFSAEVKNASPESAWLDFPVWNYLGYQAEDGTGKKLPVIDGQNRRVRVLLPGEFDGTLIVHFTPPWHWRFAHTVSLLSIAGLLLSLYINKRSELESKRFTETHSTV